MNSLIETDRIQQLNNQSLSQKNLVIYWMQASQRTSYNHALAYAIDQANKLNQPLIVYFGLTDSFPDANRRHYFFMLQGLKETQNQLKNHGIQMVLRKESPEKGILELAKKASLVVVDRGYLTIQQQWRNYAAGAISCPLIQVETDVIIPIETTSQKEEFSAATIRPKIHRNLPHYLKEITIPAIENQGAKQEFESLDLANIETVINTLDIDNSVIPVTSFHGGTLQAEKHLETFIKQKLDLYPNRNDPSDNIMSNMSPYLHFGQISPLYIARRIMHSGSPASEAYLEELIVRRELSMNYVFYNQNYDKYSGLPDWAQATLNDHRIDKRPHLYSLAELEHAETHDPYWNATQQEMIQTGKMHSYMRMYWGKKILEWTEQPEKAYETTIYLNNRYELDGRDPNGYTGIAWCYGKHDHPWKERAIFGKIRYMNDKGLERKFDIHKYAQRYQT